MLILYATIAAPVEVDLLGAHLETYVSLLPAVNTLRLCHRFGQGQHAAITRLPVELIVYIEELLTANERVYALQQWRTDFYCYKQLCEPEDHLTEKQMKPYYELARKKEIPLEPLDAEDEDDDEVRVMFHLRDEMDIWQDVHYEVFSARSRIASCC